MIPIPGMIRYDRKDTVSGQHVHVYQHHSGFKIDIISKNGFQNKYAGFLVPYGAQHTHFRDRVSDEYIEAKLGTAHFLEHCLLSSHSEEDALARLSALGVDTDAYTAATYTLFSFSCIDSFEEALRLHFEVLFEPEFSEEETQKEREVINAEYNMYKEDLSTVASNVLMRGLFRSPEMVEDILGNSETIHQIDTEDLKKMHRTFYTPSEMSLILVGNFDEESLVPLITELLDQYSVNSRKKSEIRIPLQDDHQVLIPEQRLELPSTTSSFWLGWRDKLYLGNKKRTGRELLSSRLAGELILDMAIGFGSDFFEELYSDGLADESLSYNYVVEAEYAYLLINGESLQPERAAGRISEKLEQIIRENLYDEKRINELLRSKLGGYLRSLDNVEECGEAAARIRLTHLEFTDFSAVFNQKTGENMLRELDFVVPQNRAQVIVHGRRRK